MADTKTAISFRALQLANEQRSAYGLRYNDFARYRKHCANRTHRLRSSMKLTHGKGREFKKLPPLTQDNIKDGHLQLLLLEAERAWAYSQELTAQSLEPANADHARTLRHSATGRFRRAVNWATQLLSHCQALHASGRLRASALLEATAYVLLLNGRLLRHRDEHADAVIQLAVARGLLDALAGAARTSRDQALAALFADGAGAEIRHSAHELGHKRAYDVDGIVAELAGKHRAEVVEKCDALLAELERESAEAAGDEGRRTLEPLSWEGEPVPVRNPELVDVLLKVQDAQKRLSAEQTGEGAKGKRPEASGSSGKRGVAAFDAILSALSDAEDVARKLAEAQKTSGSGSTPSAPGARDLQFVHAFIVYQLLSRRIERDLLLVSTLLNSQPTPKSRSVPASGSSASQKPTVTQRQKQKQAEAQVDSRLYPAVVKLLDTILQSLEQMRTLSIVDESPDLAGAVEGRASFTKARRCLFLARCYTSTKKYSESLSLNRSASLHLREAQNALAALGDGADPATFYPLPEPTVETLEADLAADGKRTKTDFFAHNGGQPGADPGAWKKPLFFDIALNYVQLDMERLEARAGKAAAPAAPAAPARKDAPATLAVPKAVGRAKVEEEVRATTPEPEEHARGGLGGLLGGWWGRK